MNKVVHFEVAADDLVRAKKFYHDVFGWELMDVPDMEYTMATTVATDENHMPKESGAINGGMYKRTVANQPSSFMIAVPSIDEHIKLIEQAGGKVVLPKTAVGDMGFYARINDTEGNLVGIWEKAKKSA